MTDDKVRVRFAPSPTGHLHIGGARTALYNWLLARGRGGVFILRIEDTDQSRSTDENIEEIERAMRWLGLDWDEGPGVGGEYGPYRQTERALVYGQYVEALRQRNTVYNCYCTAEELDEERKAAQAAGKPPVYSRKCRNLSQEDVKRLKGEGREPALRFAVPDQGITVVPDLVRGRVEFRNDLIGDFIIVRKEGIPTFNFANVIDDMTMKVTHIIRGDDHLSNTPRQILIYQALGEAPPQFGHLPMIVGQDKKPLSKRHGSTAVDEFHSQGYLAEALLNYLALLGWSFDDSTTIFSIKDLQQKFSIERVGKTPATFDMEKLAWMNGVYIRGLAPEELAKRLVPFVAAAGLIPELPSEEQMAKLSKAAAAVQEKIKLLPEFLSLGDYLLRTEITFEEKALEKLRGQERAAEFLDAGIEVLSKTDDFGVETLESELRALAERLEVKAGPLFGTLRISLSGKTVTAGLFESLEVLGKEESLRRLESAKKLL